MLRRCLKGKGPPLNGHVHPPQLTDFSFHVKVPVGTPPHEHESPGREHLLVVEQDIPSWGRLLSFETTILRDGKKALDMHTYSFGVTRKASGVLRVMVQIWDMCVDAIVDHDYDVSAQIHYYPE